MAHAGCLDLERHLVRARVEHLHVVDDLELVVAVSKEHGRFHRWSPSLTRAATTATRLRSSGTRPSLRQRFD